MAFQRSYGPVYGRSPFGANNAAAGPGNMNNKVVINNLDSGVTDGDVREIFQQVGRVVQAAVNYDNRGRSRGTAEVVFSNKRDAARAVQEYDRAEVDGRPMYLSLIGGSSQSQKPISQRVKRAQQGRLVPRPYPQQRAPRQKAGRRGSGGRQSNGAGRRGQRNQGQGQRSGGGRGRRGRGGRGGRGGQSQRKKKEVTPTLTAEELDREMDNYHNKTGDTNDNMNAGQPKGPKKHAPTAEQLNKDMDDYHKKSED